MKSYLAVCLFISLSVAAPISEDAEAQVVRYDNENDGLGNYKFSFETSNGITRKETGRLVNAGESDEHIEVEGEFSYKDPEGNLVFIRYTADENGYQIKDGDLLQPKPPIVAGAPPALVATLLG